jgi:hypothetical protein
MAAIGTKLPKLVGQSMSALPGYFRHQPVQLWQEPASPDVMTISDLAETLEEAKTQLAINWRKWLAWANLQEPAASSASLI